MAAQFANSHPGWSRARISYRCRVRRLSPLRKRPSTARYVATQRSIRAVSRTGNASRSWGYVADWLLQRRRDGTATESIRRRAGSNPPLHRRWATPSLLRRQAASFSRITSRGGGGNSSAEAWASGTSRRVQAPRKQRPNLSFGAIHRDDLAFSVWPGLTNSLGSSTRSSGTRTVDETLTPFPIRRRRRSRAPDDLAIDNLPAG